MKIKGVLSFLWENTAWSETCYFDSSDFAGLRVKYNDIIAKRRRLLANGAFIEKLRLTQLDKRASGQLYNIHQQGTAGDADTPWQSIAINFNSIAGARRIYRCAGVPDSFSYLGHFNENAQFLNPTIGFKTVVLAFAQALANAGGLIQFYSRNEDKRDLVGVNAAGIATLVNNGNFVVGDSLQFFRTTFDGSRESVRGRWKVVAVDADPKKFTVLHWPTGRTVSKGQLFKIVNDYSPLSAWSIGDIVSRRTGRPSGRQRGRRSIRR